MTQIELRSLRKPGRDMVGSDTRVGSDAFHNPIFSEVIEVEDMAEALERLEAEKKKHPGWFFWIEPKGGFGYFFNKTR